MRTRGIHVHVYILVVTADVTRVLLLDENQEKALSQTVANLLKDIGQQLGTENFPVSE